MKGTLMTAVFGATSGAVGTLRRMSARPAEKVLERALQFMDAVRFADSWSEFHGGQWMRHQQAGHPCNAQRKTSDANRPASQVRYRTNILAQQTPDSAFQ